MELWSRMCKEGVFSERCVCFVLREACAGQPLGSDVCSALREQPSAWRQGPSCEWDTGGPAASGLKS